MKKILILTGYLALKVGQSYATLILNEPFSYGDGSLTAVSGGAWTAHSGAGSQPIQVVSGKASYGVISGSAEDLNTPLGITNTLGDIFVSFNFNFSSLPTSTEYFAHFKDATAGNFRFRIYASTEAASSGSYRVGIRSGNGGSVQYIANDLSTSTEYKLVGRLTDSTNCTIWLSPTSESSIVNRVDTGAATLGTATSYNGSSTFALRQANGMGILTLDNLLVGTAFADVQTIGGPPSISGLVDVSIPGNSNTGPLPFLISDVETSAASLTVTANSDNPTLVPNIPANLTFGGSGANRTLTVTPAASQQGTANIEVVVTDGNSETATNIFTITVGLPTLSSASNQIALTNTVTGPVVYTVSDNETPAGSLTFTATSSDQAVLPDANISIVNGGSTRSLYLTNAGPGFSVVTVVLNDGVFDVTNTFVLTAYTTNGVLLADDFSYADGSVTANSSLLWATHSASTGQTGQTQVITGKLFLTNSASEDINRWFTNAPVLTNSGQLVFTRFVVNMISLPTANGVGEYFTHVYGLNGGFRARVFTSTNGAAAGKFRLAISSASFTPSVFPEDLSLNQSYVVISRYNTATAEAVLWVNPASESSLSVSSTDVATPVTTYGVAFRQSTGIGTMSIDDLVMGSTFSDVFLASAPSPISLSLQQFGGDVVLSWSNPVFSLQAAPFATGVYTNIPGATSPFTNSASEAQKYFRLKY